MALIQAVINCSGRLTRSQYLLTALNASFVLMLKLLNCSICCKTGSGWRVANTSPGKRRSGIRLAVAVAAAVIILAAPGPTEEVQA